MRWIIFGTEKMILKITFFKQCPVKYLKAVQ